MSYSPRYSQIKMPDIIAKFARYILTGGSAAIIDVGGFALLNQIGIVTSLAAIASFVIAAVANFWMTSIYVFGESATRARFPIFFLAAVVGLSINVGTTLGSMAILDVPPIAAKIAGIAFAFTVNFLLNVGIVFRAQSKSSTTY